MSEEVIAKFDFHADNQRVFVLPDRVTAKRFVFKLLFGGTAYGYSIDPTYFHVGYTQKQWEDVINRFYEKYYGIAAWHTKIISEAKLNRRLEIPSGRYFPYEPEIVRGEAKWPITTIKNYSIQGFGADLVKLARLECSKRLKELEIVADMVCTIHDSIVVDTPSRYLDIVARTILDSIEAVPQLCKQVWNYDFRLPLTAEVQYGQNKRNMEEYKFN